MTGLIQRLFESYESNEDASGKSLFTEEEREFFAELGILLGDLK